MQRNRPQAGLPLTPVASPAINLALVNVPEVIMQTCFQGFNIADAVRRR